MSRRKQSRRVERQVQHQNKTAFATQLEFLVPAGIFAEDRFHGNVKWSPQQLAQQALVWAWQDVPNITDAFTVASEVCEDLGMAQTAQTYTSFANALSRYRETFSQRLDTHLRCLMEQVSGRHWRNKGWLLIGFDGSRLSVPRTASNEREFCAANYGKGATAKYRRKKSKGMRRRNNERNPPHPQRPQIWVTMMWQMNVRLPWSWRLGPSNSSERQHVMEMLKQEEIQENTLFCGDAGFVGYDFWSAILAAKGDFLVRVGGNVNLLSEHANVKRKGGGIVCCWPKGKMKSGAKSLRLRLVQITIGKTKMWMLTSVLDRKRLPRKQIVAFYKMRWGMEVQFRGLKQTNRKAILRCRNSVRAYVELDWSIRAMAFAELLALREQTKQAMARQPKDRSLANTMRVLRAVMRRLDDYVKTADGLFSRLTQAVVQTYENATDKRARYRPKNPDKQPLGEPTVRKMTRHQKKLAAAA